MANTEHLVVLKFAGKADASLKEMQTVLKLIMADLKGGMNKVYNAVNRVDNQLKRFNAQLGKVGTTAKAQGTKIDTLAKQTQAYAEAVKYLETVNISKGIEKGSIAWNTQLQALNKLERQLYKTSRTMGSAGDVWYETQDRVRLLNSVLTQGRGGVESYLKAVSKVGTYGVQYSNAIKRAALQYGEGSAQFEKVSQGILKVAQSQAIAATKAELLGQKYKKVYSSRQILSEAENYAAGQLKMTRDGLVSTASATDNLDRKTLSAQKSVKEYAKGLKELGKYGTEYQKAAVAVAKDYGRDSAMYRGMYKSIKQVGDEQNRAASRAAKLGTSFQGVKTSADILNEAVARHGKVQTETSAAMGKTVKLMDQQTKGSGALQGAIGRVTTSLKTMASYAAAGAVLTGIYESIRTIGTYNQALYDLKAIGGATSLEMSAMGDVLRDTAMNTRIGLDTIITGMKQVAQAGFSASETMASIKGITELATGTMSDIGKVTDLVTTTIRAFNLEATQTGSVVDAMAVAINKSKLDVDKLNTAFNYVGIAAKAAGVDFRSATASTMILANAGLKASTIGTGLRMVWQTLSQGSSKLTAAIVKAGMSVNDFNLKTNSYSDVLRNLNTLLNSGANFYDIFSVRAGNAAIQMAHSADQVDEFTRSLYEVGSAQEMAATQMDGLVAKWGRFKNQISVTLAELGENGAIGVLGGLLDALTNVSSALEYLAGTALGKAIVTLGTFTLAVGAAVSALRLLGSVFSLGVIGGWVASIANAGASLLGFASAAGLGSAALASMAAHPVGWAIGLTAAVVGVTAAFYDWGDSMEETIKEASKTSSKAKENIVELERYKESLQQLKQGSSEWTLQAMRLVENYGDVAKGLDLATASTDDYVKSINRLIESQKTVDLEATKRMAEAQLKIILENEKKLQKMRSGPDLIGGAKRPEAVSQGIAEAQAPEIAKLIKEQEQAIVAYGAVLRSAKQQNNEAYQAMLAGIPEGAMKAKLMEIAEAYKTTEQAIKEMGNASQQNYELVKSLGSDALTSMYEGLISEIQKASGAEKEYFELKKGELDKYIKDYDDAIKEIGVKEEEGKITRENAAYEETEAKKKLFDEIVKYNIDFAKKQEQIVRDAETEKNRIIVEKYGETEDGAKKANAEIAINAANTAAEIIKIWQAAIGAIQGIVGGALPAEVIAKMDASVEAYKNIAGAEKAKVAADKKSLPRGGGGSTDIFKNEKKKIALLKSILDLEEAEAKLSVAKGEIAEEEAEIKAIERKLEVAKEYLAITEQMMGKAKSEADKDSAEKENNRARIELLNLEADKLNKLKDIRRDAAEDAMKMNKAQMELELSGINTMNTYYLEANKKRHQMAIQTTNAEIAELSRRAAAEVEGSHARNELEAELLEKKGELNREFIEYEQSLYEARMRNMDEYFRYGLMSTEEYMDLLKKQYNQGSVSALEFEKKRIMYTGTFFEQAKLGLAEWVAEQKTAGEQVVDLIKGTIDEMSSAMGNLISGLIDGSGNAQEILSNMLKNIGTKFVEFGLKNMFSNMFKGIGGSLGFDMGGLLGEESAAISTELNTTATTANTIALQGLTAAVSTAGFMGPSGVAIPDVDLGGAASSMESAGDAVASAAAESSGTISDWSSNTGNILSNLFNSVVSGLGSIFGGGSGGGGLFGSLFSFIGDMFEKGGAFGNHGKLYAYGKGDVFSKPHMFKFKKGGTGALGVLGEKGHEAVMPLKRDAQGNLGVSAQGSGSSSPINIINVVDQRMVLDALGTADGQRLILNTISANQRTFKKIVR